MLYCPACATLNHWPSSFDTSSGPCEVCGRSTLCYDYPSRYLPPFFKEEEEKELDSIVYLNELMDIIDHPEALVSDRSILWDFFGNETEPVEELTLRLGFKVYRNTYLVDIAEEMEKMMNRGNK